MYGYAVVDAISVIITHLSETVKRHSNELLGRQEVSQILENVKKYNRGLVEDTIPSVISIGDLQKILGNLLSESLPIKDMITILETICDYGSVTKDTDMLTEYVRQALKRTISRLYVRNNKLNAIVLDPELEKSIMSSVRKTEHGSYVAMQPDAMQRIVTSLIEELKKVKGKGDKIIVLTSPVVRFYFRKMTEQLLPEITILSYNELESNVQVTALATIQ